MKGDICNAETQLHEWSQAKTETQESCLQERHFPGLGSKAL